MAQLPIGDFLRARLKEFDSNFEVRPGTAFESMFFKPLQYITQPLYDEMLNSFIGQSFSRILQQEDPDAYDEEAVDALASNLYVERRSGAYSKGTARVYYNEPNPYEYAANSFVAVSSSGIRYLNPEPFIISRAEMTLNIEDGLYYYDIFLQSEVPGADTVVETGNIVSVENDDTYIRVSNLTPFTGGVDRETNTQFIERTRNSIGVRDLLTGKGFNAILFETFPSFLREMTIVGFGDREMMRDIVFNTHIGGKVDAYMKTSGIKTSFTDFFGLDYDFTRQTKSSKNCLMLGTDWTDLGNPNIDRSNGLVPVAIEIKDSVQASYTSTVDMSTPISLLPNHYVKIGIDGVIKDIRVAGVSPSFTSRNEIINLINYAFGVNVAFVSGNSFQLRSPTYGLSGSIYLDHPTIGVSALSLVFGVSTATTFLGDGPVTFFEGVHYEIDDEAGRIRRIAGPTVVPTQTTGQTTEDSEVFRDFTFGIFNPVTERDILTINSGPDAGDYRILEIIDYNNIRLDRPLTTTALTVSYKISQTGIKSGELIYITYYYNPLSIDIGKLIKLDDYGRERGIRPGREDFTITDLPLVRITQIEEIDPLTAEPTGTILDSTGGFGQGGYGRGGFGRGAGRDWALRVNSPTERFSMFEDSYIVFLPSLVGLSYRVHYEYAPELEEVHNFCRSDLERIVDGDILVKHYLPAYVSGTIRYSMSATNASTVSNETMLEVLKAKINATPAGTNLEYSDLIQIMVRTLDPYDRYTTFIRPFTLTAEVHNTNGTIDKVSGEDSLVIPTLDPFPIETTRPLSADIAHWIADNIVLERL